MLTFALLAPVVCLTSFRGVAPAAAEHETPVAVIPDHAFRMATREGPVEVPWLVSHDESHPLPQITRAIIRLHGKGRDVDGYYRSLERAAEEAGRAAKSSSILIAPQFINEEDAAAHHVPGEVLRWRRGVWEAGTPAAGPLPVSAYEVLDALVEHLANRAEFPNLQWIVLAGHSGGGQAIQRYAIVGNAESSQRPGGGASRYGAPGLPEDFSF